MARFRPVLAIHDLTEQQWRVIRVLAERSPLDASEVAERACVLAPSLTRIIKTLEERGFIRRERDRDDARRALLSLNEAGFELIRIISPQSRALYTKIETHYGREKMERLIELLNDLAATREDNI